MANERSFQPMKKYRSFIYPTIFASLLITTTCIVFSTPETLPLLIAITLTLSALMITFGILIYRGSSTVYTVSDEGIRITVSAKKSYYMAWSDAKYAYRRTGIHREGAKLFISSEPVDEKKLESLLGHVFFLSRFVIDGILIISVRAAKGELMEIIESHLPEIDEK